MRGKLGLGLLAVLYILAMSSVFVIPVAIGTGVANALQVFGLLVAACVLMALCVVTFSKLEWKP